jgi:hypothetical protein
MMHSRSLSILLAASLLALPAIAAPNHARLGEPSRDRMTPVDGDAFVHKGAAGTIGVPRPMRNTRCYDGMRRAGLSPCAAAHGCGMPYEIVGALCY